MSLTTDNLRKLSRMSDMEHKLSARGQEFFDIDDRARSFLQSEFNLHIDDSNFKRSTTNFDRTVATRAFDRTNQSLRDSQRYRLSQSGFLPTRRHSKEFNMALQEIRSWANEHSYNSKESFEAMCRHAHKSTKVLNENDLWEACKQISTDITEQQAQELFRVLDSNRDGLVTPDDWAKSVHFENNGKFRDLVQHIKKKKYGIGKVLSLLELEGVRKVAAFTLRNGLKKLWPALSDDDALLLSRYISGGKDEVEVEKIIDMLNISEGQTPPLDDEWQERFTARLKRKMEEKGVTEEELAGRFKIYDRQTTGYIEQVDFKTVLAEIGIGLNLNELMKLVKFVPLDRQNRLQYGWVINALYDSASDSK